MSQDTETKLADWQKAGPNYIRRFIQLSPYEVINAGKTGELSPFDVLVYKFAWRNATGTKNELMAMEYNKAQSDCAKLGDWVLFWEEVQSAAGFFTHYEAQCKFEAK